MIRFVESVPPPAVRSSQAPECTEDGCHRPCRSHDLCTKHLDRRKSAQRQAQGLLVSGQGGQPRRNMRRAGKLCEAGCGRPVHARGYCHSCYKTHAPRKPCRTPDCPGHNHAQGLCTNCYARAMWAQKRHDRGGCNCGQTPCVDGIRVVRAIGRPVMDRFMESVVPAYASCELWTGHVDGGGQPRFTPSDGQSWCAHRWLWAQHGGVLPTEDGRSLPLVHLCRVVTCVNPEHLEIVSYVESVRRVKVAAGERSVCRADRRWVLTSLQAYDAGAENFPSPDVVRNLRTWAESAR